MSSTNTENQIKSNDEGNVSTNAIITSHYLFSSMPAEFIDDDILKVIHLDCFHNEDRVAQSAINLLKKIGSEKTHQYLFAIIKDYPEERQLWALDAFYSIGNDTILQPLIDFFNVSYDEDIKCSVLRVLAKYGHDNEEIKKLILDHAKEELADSPLRYAAIEALGDLEAVDEIKDALSSRSEKIIITAILALGKVNNIDSVHLIKRLCQQFNKHPKNVQIALIKALLNLENDYVTELIRQIFHENNEEKVKEVLDIVKNNEYLLKYPIRITKTFLRMAECSDSLEEKIIETFTSYFTSSSGMSQKSSTEIAESIESTLRSYFAKFKTNYVNDYKANLSLKTQIEQDLFLAKEYLEKFADSAFVQRISNYLKKEDFHVKSPVYLELNSIIAQSAKKITGDYFQHIRSILRLLESKDKLERTRVAAYLNSIDFKKKHHINRLNRLLYFVSITKSQKCTDISYEIFRWGLQLQERNLTKTAIIALGRSGHKILIKEAEKSIFPLNNHQFNIATLVSLGELQQKEAIPVIINFFKNSEYNEDVYVAVINALKNIDLKNDRASLETLLKLFIQSPSDSIRFNAAMAFSNLASDKMIPTLAKYKSSKVEKIREMLPLVVGKLYEHNDGSSKEMVENFFYSMLKDTLLDAKLNSLVMLHRMGDKYSIDVLKDLFQKTPDIKQLSEIIMKTVEIDSLDKIYWLVRLLSNDHEEIQRSVSLALVSLLEGESKNKKTISDLVKDFRLKPFADKQIDEIDTIKETQMDLSKAQDKEKFQFERENTKELTILFIDITGYTKKSSTMELMEIMNYLKNYEEIAIPLFKAHFGTVVKKMGDGLMLSFPLAIYGCLAAIRLQEKLKNYNQFKPDKEKIICRVGLNTGSVAVHGEDLFGDTVNVASRMETKATPGGVLVSDATFQHIKDYITYEDMGGIQVKGKDHPIHSYSLLAASASLPANLDPLVSGDQAVTDTGSVIKQDAMAEIEKIKALINLEADKLRDPMKKRILYHYRVLYKNVFDNVTDTEAKEKLASLILNQWQDLKSKFF